jgi:sulfite reductase (NADPH) flavoprotein alpha-component
LDSSVVSWKNASQINGLGQVPQVVELETRVGAGSAVFGYLNNIKSTADTPLAQSLLATSGTLGYLQTSLSRNALEPASGRPLSVNVAAVEYSDKSSSLVNDYVSVMNISKIIGLGLVSGCSVKEVQHMSLLTSILSTYLPSIHVYEGIWGNSQSLKIENVLSSNDVAEKYKNVVSNLTRSSDYSDLSGHITSLLSAFNGELGTSYNAFEYTGSAEATSVLVTFGSAESTIATDVVKNLSNEGSSVGVLSVRIYRPFLEVEFLKVLPKSTKKIIVLGQVKTSEDVLNTQIRSNLFTDVMSTLFMNSMFTSTEIPDVNDHKYSLEKVWSCNDIYEILGAPYIPSTAEESKKFVFWDLDSSSLIDSPATVGHVLSLNKSSAVSYAALFNNQSLGGVVEIDMTVNSEVSHNGQHADLVFVNDTSILSDYDVLACAKNGGSAIIATKNNADEVEKISDSFKTQAAQKKLKLFIVDYDAIGENPETHGRTRSMIQQIAFWKVAYPELTIDQVTTKIVLANGKTTELVAATVANLLDKVNEVGIVELQIPKEWAEISDNSEKSLLTGVAPDSFLPRDREEDSIVIASSQNLVEVTKQYVFKELYDLRSEIRPDLPVENFVAKVQLNKRVTPEDYERHIFHMELDITGTGLVYNIGESLGIHAPNNEESVREFIEWYGVNTDEVIIVPSRENGELEARTVYQILRDNLDIFGKPPKRFYETLAPYAKDEKERLHLGRLACATGVEELKKRTDEEFCTYADILREFKSARPSFADLVNIVAPLKRREYSIASSQKLHPNTVHLLIVVVDWIDSKGRQRFGQCSKYLADLQEGVEVIVSVKPSVMKLPPLTTQPVIMSGLGTGLAPFKAFLEEKAWQKSQGYEIGDVFLFLGSRHQNQEYLYG